MFNDKLLEKIANGMKGNADALLAFTCLVSCGALLGYGVNQWVSFGFPLIIFVLYVLLRLHQKHLDVRMKEIEFDREKESNRAKIENKKRKVLK